MILDLTWRGEKYEKLRRLGPQPFSCAFRRRSKPKPLVYVDVKASKVGGCSFERRVKTLQPGECCGMFSYCKYLLIAISYFEIGSTISWAQIFRPTGRTATFDSGSFGGSKWLVAVKVGLAQSPSARLLPETIHSTHNHLSAIFFVVSKHHEYV